MSWSFLSRFLAICAVSVALAFLPQASLAQRGGGGFHGGGGGFHGGGGGFHGGGFGSGFHGGGFRGGSGAFRGGNFGGFRGGNFGRFGGFRGDRFFRGFRGDRFFFDGFPFFGFDFGFGPWWWDSPYYYSPYYYGYPWGPDAYSYPCDPYYSRDYCRGYDDPPSDRGNGPDYRYQPAPGHSRPDNSRPDNQTTTPSGASGQQGLPDENYQTMHLVGSHSVAIGAENAAGGRSSGFQLAEYRSSQTPLRPAVKNALAVLRAMPPEARQRWVNSGRYSSFSPAEKALLRSTTELAQN